MRLLAALIVLFACCAAPASASVGPRLPGDGGYLFDPRGNLRAWLIYN